MKDKIPAFLLSRGNSSLYPQKGRYKTCSYIDKGIHQAAHIIKSGYIQWETASGDSFFQKIDARIKLLFLIFFIIIVSVKRDIQTEILIAVFIFFLMITANLGRFSLRNIFGFYRRVIFFGFIFGFVIALPSAFNVITKGEIIESLPVVHLSRPFQFWIYHIPKDIGVTKEGAFGVLMLILRSMNSISLTLFVISITTFPEIIKALNIMKVSDNFLMVITLSYKYIFIFAKTVFDIYLAKKSRMLAEERSRESGKWIAGRIAFIFKKTMVRSEEIIKAMKSRGFSDNIKIYGARKLCIRDWITGTGFFVIGLIFLWM